MPVLTWRTDARCGAAADDIFAALSASLSSTDGAAREAASAQLQRWERAAAPGFAAGLVDIASRAVRARHSRARAQRLTPQGPLRTSRPPATHRTASALLLALSRGLYAWQRPELRWRSDAAR
jgi:hypothetical protein